LVWPHGRWGRKLLGYPEVKDLGLATGSDENIRGFDVSMDDAARVRRLQGVGHLDREAEQFIEL
jgi:hypothetical protein